MKDEREIDNDMCNGPLELIIRCGECSALYALNPDAIAIAIITGANIKDYIKFVQTSFCSACGAKPIKKKESEVSHNPEDL